MQQQTRELLKAHTADLIRPRYDQSQAAIALLVTTVHDPDATDAQAEDAALAFIEAWGGHPVYRKTARYGLVLHTMRHRPEVADKVTAFSRHVNSRLRYAGGIEDWYATYTRKAVAA